MNIYYKTKFKELAAVMLITGIFFTGCTKKVITVPPPPALSEVFSISGGSVSTVASDNILWLTSLEILDNNDSPIVNGTGFNVTGSTNVQVSLDGLNFSESVKVPSKLAKIKFAVKVPTSVGVYKILVTQTAKQSRNARGFFFLDVKPNVANSLGTIVSSRFEDQPPYSGVYQSGYKYSALADGQTTVSLTIGPILDKFGNTLQEGKVNLLVDAGQITSDNPASISDGSVYFTYLPTTSVGPVNVKAQVVDEQANLIIKETTSVIYQVKPKLSVTTLSNLGLAIINQAKQFPVTVKNTGTTDVLALNIKTSQPFSLPNLSECPTVLHPDQSCQVSLQVLTPDRGVKTGLLSLSGSPSTIAESSLDYPINVQVTAPPSLTISVDSVLFGSLYCGDLISQDLFVTNTGESDATNFQLINPASLDPSAETTCSSLTTQTLCSTAVKCRWFHSPDSVDNTNDYCTSRPFDLVIQPADINPSADPNVVINCGNKIPANGRKCRVQVVGTPRYLYSTQSVVGKVKADGVDPISLSINSSAIVGKPTGNFPITFNPGIVSLSTGANTTVSVGPVKDSCGNSVANNTPFTASVTAGTLNNQAGVFLGGISTLFWTGTNNLSDLGPQSITVNAGTMASVTRITTFTGSNLTISGPIDLGEISLDSPQQFVWTIKNNGNGSAATISYSFKNLVNVNVSNQSTNCSSLNPSSSCTVTATFTPNLGTNQTVVLGGDLNINSTGYGQTSSVISFTGFGHKSLDLINGNVPYYLGNQKAGIPLSRKITLNNPQAASITGLSYSFNGDSTGWSFSQGTCSATLGPGTSCDLTINYNSTLAGVKVSTMQVNSSLMTTQINLSVNMTPNDPAIIAAIIPASMSIPADGSSTDQLTIGPVTDVYGNAVIQGTKVFVSIDNGSIVETQPLTTDSAGKVFATVLSSTNQVGTINIKAQVIGYNSVVAFKQINFSGVSLVFNPNSVDFGSVAIGQSKDVTVTLMNAGNIDATGLNINTSNSSIFSIVQLDSCSTGRINAGASCNLVIRLSPQTGTTKNKVSGTLNAKSSVLTGQNNSTIPIVALNILPATLVADINTVSVQLIPGQVYPTTVTLSNIGDDVLKNFNLSANNPAITLGDYQGCIGLGGGQSCTFTLTFNANGISNPVSAIVTATGDNTSANINFTSDYIKLVFINQNFIDNVLTCHPVQLQSQDSNLNPMIVQTSQLIGLTSSRSGTFYRSKTCSGTTVSKVGIFAGNTTSELVYFLPKIAGKHIFTASESGVPTKTQENLANLVVTPGSILSVAPMQNIQFGAVGANGSLSCSFVSNNTSAKSFDVTGPCNYIAGKQGIQIDQIILQDSDTPPNTASIQVTTTKAISINPPISLIESGAQVQFLATDGSKQGFKYTITPAGPNQKIGSSIYNNLYTAGQNITDTDNIQELVTVTDSLGATAAATVYVKKSVFKQNQIVSPPTTGKKNVAMWKNIMIVGDPTADVTTSTTIVQGGQVHIYNLDSTTDPTKPIWRFVTTITSANCSMVDIVNCANAGPYTDGHFGSSVSIFNNKVIVGAPDEAGDGSTSKSGAAYYFTVDTGGFPSELVRLTYNNVYPQEILKQDEKFGSSVSISGNYLAVGAIGKGIVQPFLIGNFNPTQSNAIETIYPLSVDNMVLYSDLNYGGTYIALGSPNENYLTNKRFGKVSIYKLQPDEISFTQSYLPSESSSDFANDFNFGSAISMYGPYLSVGAPGADGGKGRVYLFSRDPNANSGEGDNVWSKQFVMKGVDFNPQINGNTPITDASGKITTLPGAGFGSSLAQFGNYLMVGSVREVNYPDLNNSGSVYLFQRYLSDDNQWEYLGQIKSTDYGVNDNYGQSMAIYTNNYLIGNSNISGNVYYYTGAKSKNVWPFGFHGSFDLAQGKPQYENYSQPIGRMRDWSSFILPDSSDYTIVADNSSAVWSTIGVANDMEIRGKITAKEIPAGVLTAKGRTVSANLPDESGYYFGKLVSYTFVQNAGGRGGNPGFGVNRFQTWGDGDQQPYWNEYYLGSNNANIFSGYVAGADGSDGYGGKGGNGGDATLNGGWRVNGCDRKRKCNGGMCEGTPVTHTDSAGGDGKKPGNHGQPIYIKANRVTVSAQAQIDVTGSMGTTGGEAGFFVYNEIWRYQTGIDDFPDCLGNRWVNNASRENIQSWSGGNGGGGGGAGGTGGYVLIEAVSHNITTSLFNVAGSPGAGGGPATFPGLLSQSSGNAGSTGSTGNAGGFCYQGCN